MSPSESVGVIASSYGLSLDELELMLDAVSISEASRVRWMSVFQVVAKHHSGKFHINLNEGCLTGAETTTSVEALARTINETS